MTDMAKLQDISLRLVCNMCCKNIKPPFFYISMASGVY